MTEDFNRFITNEEMQIEFAESIGFHEGRKYIKVTTKGSAWGFIVKSADAKFKEGDILKAASWASPARNAARANLFQPETFINVNWTGPGYLR